MACRCVLGRREAAERTVRPVGVVLDSPPLDNRTGVGHVDEPVLVQAFIAQPTVEALDVGVLHGLARTDEG